MKMPPNNTRKPGVVDGKMRTLVKAIKSLHTPYQPTCSPSVIYLPVRVEIRPAHTCDLPRPVYPY